MSVDRQREASEFLANLQADGHVLIPAWVREAAGGRRSQTQLPERAVGFDQTPREVLMDKLKFFAVVERPACLAGPKPQTCPKCRGLVVEHPSVNGMRVCMPLGSLRALVNHASAGGR